MPDKNEAAFHGNEDGGDITGVYNDDKEITGVHEITQVRNKNKISEMQNETNANTNSKTEIENDATHKMNESRQMTIAILKLTTTTTKLMTTYPSSWKIMMTFM